MTTQEDWAARLTHAIAAQIKRLRTGLGWSAQRLSDECGKLGVDIPRSVISDLEIGRRASVSVAELMVIATALGVPPLLLICPVGDQEEIELLPGRTAPPFRALQWLAGESRFPGPGSGDGLAPWIPDGGPAFPLAAYRLNDLISRTAILASGHAHECESRAAGAATEGEREAWQQAAAAYRREADKALGEREAITSAAQSNGWIAPPVIGHLQEMSGTRSWPLTEPQDEQDS